MAAPYSGQQAYPPPTQPYPQGGYQPAPAQFQPQQDKQFPAQPPAYQYGAQPTAGYQPMPAPAPVTATSTTVVMTAQPTPVTTTYQAPPQQEHYGMAVCALVFSIITLICCGWGLLYLTCSIPALILAIVALTTTGSSQKSNAGISIGLNVAVIMCFVIAVIIVVPTYVVGVAGALSTRYCSSYYSYSYSTYCTPDSYSVCSTCLCTFYSSTGRYCPSNYI